MGPQPPALIRVHRALIMLSIGHGELEQLARGRIWKTQPCYMNGRNSTRTARIKEYMLTFFFLTGPVGVVFRFPIESDDSSGGKGTELMFLLCKLALIVRFANDCAR